jgi:hypothetical protein
MTDDISVESDGGSSANLSFLAPRPSYMELIESSQVKQLVDIREEDTYKWKHMKEKRDQRLAAQKEREDKESMLYNFKRVVMNTEKNEFNRAYQEQYMHHEYIAQKHHSQRLHERKMLDANMKKRHDETLNRQRTERKFMQAMLKESKQRAIAMHREEIMQQRSANELNGLYSTSMVGKNGALSSSIVTIPESMENRVKTAKRYLSFYCFPARNLFVDFFQCLRQYNICLCHLNVWKTFNVCVLHVTCVEF